MPTTFTPDQVTIREVAPTRVAIFEHRGDPETLDVTIQRFIAWRKAAGCRPRPARPSTSGTPSGGPPTRPTTHGPVRRRRRRSGPIEALGEGEPVKAGEIPGGRCAVLRVTGDTHNLEPAAMYLYRDWLPASGEEMRDFPIYCQRFFLDEPAQGTAAELHLPLK
jgi:AraC family transcriptional regulator